jgi:hypothetical protein
VEWANKRAQNRREPRIRFGQRDVHDVLVKACICGSGSKLSTAMSWSALLLFMEQLLTVTLEPCGSA